MVPGLTRHGLRDQGRESHDRASVRTATVALWVAIVVASSGLASCRRSTVPRAFVVDDAVKIGADGRILSLVPLTGYRELNPAWDGLAITVAGARGETVAFQLVVEAGSRPVRGVTARFPDLRGEAGGVIARDRFAVFREWYIAVTAPSTSPGGSAGPGEYPDALIPAATPRWGLPVDVSAGKTQALWVDLAIPRSSAPGTYRGTVSVHADDRELGLFDLVLTVRSFELPSERHLRWRVGYSGWEAVPAHFGIAEGTPEWLRLEEELYRLLWEGHRLVPTTHYSHVRLPVRGNGAELAIDWTGFDARFRRYLDGSAFADGQRINVFSLPVNLQTGWPGRRAAGDPAFLTAIARAIGRHWDEKGWRLEDAFVYVADEPESGRYADLRRACQALHAGDRRIATSVAFYTEFGRDARRIVDEFGGLVTMWDIAGDYADLPALRARQAAGDTVGIYQGGEPFEGGEALDDDGLALTTWPWVAWRYRLDTLFLYNATEWDYHRLDRSSVRWAVGKREIWENPLNQSWATNSQGVLLYPGQYVGARGTLPSIRLKEVRRGMQDYEYLWLASKLDAARVDAIARRIVPRALYEAGTLGQIGSRGAWERDPRAWASARRELAAIISAASEPPR
jgi:hypothetical protein